MGEPKRHHWWPKAQTAHWVNEDKKIFVTRKNGTCFQSNPVNIGVESELYTRFDENEEKDTRIETWFANEIDEKIPRIIDYLLDLDKITRFDFQPNAMKAQTLKNLGFRVRNYVEILPITPEIRMMISSYIAALLVRNPIYLKKLVNYHKMTENDENSAKNHALFNMLELYSTYKKIISKSILLIIKRSSDNEFLYSDGGLVVTEPWREKYGIPFDIHAPLTPEIAVQVLPLPEARDLYCANIIEATNQGVSRMNKIILGGALRFVFSRRYPPIEFIKKNFGVPAPKNIGYRIRNGRLETIFDPRRS